MIDRKWVTVVAYDYGNQDVIAALKFVWDVSNNLCGEPLHPVIPEYVAVLEKDTLWRYGAETTRKLCAMSEGSVKAYVSSFAKVRRKRTGLSGTKSSLLKEITPIATGPWNDKPSGYGQVDTVSTAAHLLVETLKTTMRM